MTGPREFFTRFVTLLNDRDREALAAMFHPDFTAETPQSGERSRGFELFWAQFDMYPGGAPVGPLMPEARLFGDDERWAITPAYTVVPLSAPNEFTLIYRDTYPDGTLWHVLMSLELRDGMLYRMEIYFAPALAAPLAESIASFSRG